MLASKYSASMLRTGLFLSKLVTSVMQPRKAPACHCPTLLSSAANVQNVVHMAADSGLGSFNDRLRDGALGGSPFSPSELQVGVTTKKSVGALRLKSERASGGFW